MGVRWKQSFYRGLSLILPHAQRLALPWISLDLSDPCGAASIERLVLSPALRSLAKTFSGFNLYGTGQYQSSPMATEDDDDIPLVSFHFRDWRTSQCANPCLSGNCPLTLLPSSRTSTLSVRKTCDDSKS